MQDLLWENRPTKGRRQVVDIGEAKILKIRHFERERGVNSYKFFWLEIKNYLRVFICIKSTPDP